VRVELFRSGRTCQLLVTRHQPSKSENHRRPSIESTMLFRGVNGFMDLPPGNRNEPIELQSPRFWTRSGEERPLPILWKEAVIAAVRGVCCVGCSHIHFLMMPSELTVGADGN
jgi:hypothetical protein